MFLGHGCKAAVQEVTGCLLMMCKAALVEALKAQVSFSSDFDGTNADTTVIPVVVLPAAAACKVL